jgi:ABC-type multidrug transport system ATPase subunit
MSERILKALMQLFAIIARPDSDANDRKLVVSAYLNQLLNKELAEKYLVVFDSFYEANQAKSSRTEKKRQTISASSVKVLKICSEINEELTQNQKYVVLVQLLEFIKSEESISDQELEFVETVADAFNVPVSEYGNLRDFVIKRFDEIPSSSHILLINNEVECTTPEVKHIYSEGLTGKIKVFNIHSVNILMFRSKGVGEVNLNGQLIREDKVNFLSIGSAIRNNKIKPIYYSVILSTYNVDKSKACIVFETKEVVYRFKGGKIGLHKMNFREESGNLVGIMGASGAGKSTLLNVLNSSYRPTEGAVTINDIDIHNDKEGRLNGLIGHVSQDDLLIEELSVFQNLYYNAKLCFDNLIEPEIIEKVNKVLSDLGLYEIRALKVGNPLNKKISGGQRKRLNIALELIREPAILFLDEPTSGLSSKDSENIMDLLKELSLKGKLVFVVIHQPSSDIFKTFDKLIILDTGGFQIYYGDPVDSITYFKKRISQADWNESECPTCGNVNPEQVFKIVEANVVDEYGNLTPVRKFKPTEWYDLYEEQQTKERNSVVEDAKPSADMIPEIDFKIPNWFRQLKVFITRDVLSKISNSQYILINALESPIIAGFLAYIIKFYSVDVNNEFGYTVSDNENLPVYLFMLVICAIFIGLTVSAEEIIADRRILKREQFLNLSRSSYLVSKVLILIALSILQIQGMFFQFWLVAFSVWLCANMIGLNISDSFKTAVTIYILIPFLVIPQIILSGIIVKFDKLNPEISNPKEIPIYGEVMTSRWAYEALAVTQFKNNDFEKVFYPYEKAMSQSDFKKNYWVRTLRNKITAIENGLTDKSKRKKVETDLEVLRNEIGKEMTHVKKISFNKVSSLYINKVTPEILEEANSYLDILNAYYVKKYNMASMAKDKVIEGFTRTEDDKKKFVLFKKMYYNENLSDFCRNSSEVERVVEYNGQLYQKIDPIFQDPDNKFLRAHFYAPRKQIFGTYYDTYWINVIVIWLMTLFFYATLYFKALKRFLDFLERMSEKLIKDKE